MKKASVFVKIAGRPGSHMILMIFVVNRVIRATKKKKNSSEEQRRKYLLVGEVCHYCDEFLEDWECVI